MKSPACLVAVLVLTLPVVAQASDGAEALQRFHERTQALFDKQAENLEKRKQQAQQKAEKEKEETADARQQDNQLKAL